MSDKTLVFQIKAEGDAVKTLADIDNRLKTLAASKKALQKEYEKEGKLTRQQQADYKKISAETEVLTKKKSALVKETRKYAQEATTVQGSMGRLRAETASLRAENENLNLSTEAGRRKFEQNSRQIVENTKKIRDYDRSISGSSTLVGEYSKGFAGLGKNMLSMIGLGGGVMTIMNKLSQAFKNGIADLKAFETGQLNVQSLLEKFDATLEQRTIDLMKTYGLQIEDTNKALFDAVSAGVDAGNATEFLGTSAKLAIAGVTDMKTATDGLTTIINAYRLEVGEADKVANAFFTAQKFGKTTVAQLSTEIGAVAPIAKAAGVSYQELLSAFAELTKLGISTAESGTALKATISALIAPSKEAKDVMTELGIETGITAVKNRGLMGTLLDVVNATRDNEDKIVEIIPNIRALTGVTALNEEALADYQKILREVTTDTGDASSMTKGFEMQMNSLQKQADIANAKLKEQSILLGKNLKPAWESTKGAAGGALAVLNKMIYSLQVLSGATVRNAIEQQKFDEYNAKIAFIEEQRNKGQAEADAIELENQQMIAIMAEEDRLARIRIAADEKKNAEDKKNALAREKKYADELTAAMAKANKSMETFSTLYYQQITSADEQSFIEGIINQVDKGFADMMKGVEQTNKDVTEQAKKTNKELTDETLARADKEVEDFKIAEENKKLAADYLYAAGLDALDGYYNMRLNKQRNAMQKELAAAGDNEAAKSEIMKKYARKEKKIALTKAIIDTALMVLSAAQTKPFIPVGLAAMISAGAMGGAQVATIATQQLATGGSVKSGHELPGFSKSQDNTLVLVKPGEVILNSRQQRSLGGPSTFRKIGVPGFTEGGVAGAPITVSPTDDMNRMMRAMIDGINEKDVVLNIHKLYEAERELNTVTGKL